jgi:prepilin-type N-terminal cleavage/methylation domain-containing protein
MRLSLRKSQRGSETAAQSRESRKGFSLVEVIVAMVLLAVAVSSLAALVYSVSKSGVKTSGDAYRNGILMQEVNRLEGIPYDSIANGTTTYSVSSGSYAHTRVITVAEPVLQRVKTIQIVLTPTNTRFKPDTVNFTRTKARTSKVLCTFCQ